MAFRVSGRVLLLAGASSLVLAAGLAAPVAEAATTTITTTITTKLFPTDSLSITSTGAVHPSGNGGAIELPTTTPAQTVGFIINDGTIIGPTGPGIYGPGAWSIGSIVNNGLIQANFPVRMDGGTLGSLTNSATGIIQGQIYFALTAQVGTITNAGLINRSNGTAFTVQSSNTYVAALINSGTISASGSFSSGITVYGSLGSLNNSGLIKVPANSTAINISTAISSFINTGTIIGDIRYYGAPQLTIMGGSGAAFGTLMGQSISSPAVLYSFNSPLTFAGNTLLNDTVSASAVTNTGILRIQRNTTISGAYSQPSSATLMIDVGTVTYGALTVTGAATLTNGSIVMQAAPSATIATGAYTLVSGSTLGTDYTGVSVTAAGFLVATATTIVGATNQLVATLSVAPPAPTITTPAPTPTPSTPAIPAAIDGSKTFGNADAAVQGSIVTFNGGVLQPTAPLTLNQVVIGQSNGTISPNGSTVTLAGSVSGTGQLIVNSPGAVVVSGSLTNTGGVAVQSGSLVVNGAVGGPVTVANAGTLQGNGTIQAPATVAGLLSPGASPGLLTFTAPVTLLAGSTFLVEVDGAVPTSYDRVIVNGASFTAGGRITPVLRGISGAATNSYSPPLGQTFQVVSASGGVSGRFSSLVQPAAGLAAGTRFDILYAPTAMTLAVTPASYANLAAAGLSQSANQRAVGAALESIRPAAGGVAPALFDALYPLPAARIGPALNQLSGQIHADTLEADRANRFRFGRAISARQAGAGGSAPGAVQMSTGARTDVSAGSASGAPDNEGAWGQLLVSRRDSDGADGVTGGFILGADRAVDDTIKLGMAIGFQRTDVKAGTGLGKGQVDSYQAAAYATWKPNVVFVDANLGYGISGYDASRAIDFLGDAAYGKADGQDISADLSVGTRLTRNQAWLEPRVGLRWDHIERGGFSESGGSSAALREDEVNQDNVRSSLGARFGATRDYGGVTLSPTAVLAWEHDFDDAALASAALAGAHFRTLADRGGRDAVVVGAGLGAHMSDRLSAQVDYLGEIRDGAADHSVSAGLRLAF